MSNPYDKVIQIVNSYDIAIQITDPYGSYRLSICMEIRVNHTG